MSCEKFVEFQNLSDRMKWNLKKSIRKLKKTNLNAITSISGQPGIAWAIRQKIMAAIMKQFIIIKCTARFRKSTWTARRHSNDWQFLSVCEKPIYIEAREKKSKRDWTRSNSILIHQVKNSTKWAYGFSTDFG